MTEIESNNTAPHRPGPDAEELRQVRIAGGAVEIEVGLLAQLKDGAGQPGSAPPGNIGEYRPLHITDEQGASMPRLDPSAGINEPEMREAVCVGESVTGVPEQEPVGGNDETQARLRRLDPRSGIRKERVIVSFLDEDLPNLLADVMATCCEIIARVVGSWTPSGQLDKPETIEIIASVEVELAIPTDSTAEQVATDFRALVASETRKRIEGALIDRGSQTDLRNGKAVHKIPDGWELVRKLPFSPAHLHKQGVLAAVDFCGHCGHGVRLLTARHTGGSPERLNDEQTAVVLAEFQMTGAVEDTHPERDPATRLYQFEASASETQG